MIAAWTFLPNEIPNVAAFLLMGTGAAMVFSMAKAGFGGALGLLATPLMVYACGADTKLATGVLLPLLIFADQVAMITWWRRWKPRVVALLLPGAVVGIAAGGAAFWGLSAMEQSGARDVSNAALMLGIGLIALGFVAIQAYRGLRGNSLTFRPVLWQGTCFGAVAGFTSTVAHGAGPVTAMYLLPQKLPKDNYVATTVLYYWINNLLKVPVYLSMGRMGAATVGASVVLIPGVVAGTLIGLFLHKRLGQRQFNAVVYALLALTGAHLTYKAIEAIIASR